MCDFSITVSRYNLQQMHKYKYYIITFIIIYPSHTKEMLKNLKKKIIDLLNQKGWLFTEQSVIQLTTADNIHNHMTTKMLHSSLHHSNGPNILSHYYFKGWREQNLGSIILKQ